MKTKPKFERTSVVGYFEKYENDTIVLTTNDEDLLATGNLAGVELPQPGCKEYVVTGIIQRFNKHGIIEVESTVVATCKQQFDAALEQTRVLLSQNEDYADELIGLIQALLCDVHSPDAAAVLFVFAVQGYAWTQWDSPMMFVGNVSYCYEQWKTGKYANGTRKQQIALSE